jgi:hypothetical protein
MTFGFMQLPCALAPLCQVRLPLNFGVLSRGCHAAFLR